MRVRKSKAPTNIGFGMFVFLASITTVTELRAASGAVANAVRDFRAMTPAEQTEFLRELRIAEEAKPAPAVATGQTRRDQKRTAAARVAALPEATVSAMPARQLAEVPLLSKRV